MISSIQQIHDYNVFHSYIIHKTDTTMKLTVLLIHIKLPLILPIWILQDVPRQPLGEIRSVRVNKARMGPSFKLV